jgi:hypothetical protein
MTMRARSDGNTVSWLLPILAVLGIGVLALACGTDPGAGDGSISQPGDADGDTISDDDELRGHDHDTDGDGTPDYLDDDSDGDGLPDAFEAGDAIVSTPPVDSDGDGTPDFRDLDADDNGILDEREGMGDTDGDGVPDHADDDDDDDLVRDRDELMGRTDFPRDLDSDGIPDFRDPDSDGDTILDGHEWNRDTDEDGTPDVADLDSDGDGLADALEAGDGSIRTPPVDTDGDLIPDVRDLDSDNDGLSDASERAAGTDPRNEDSDDDGVSDLIEVGAGTDALDPNDNPRVRGDFVFLVPYDAPPSPSRDTIAFRTNVQLADVYFLFDLTASMGDEIMTMRNATVQILDELTCEDFGTPCANIADCASHDDAVCGPNGTCIEDPELTFCIASLWTGVGTYEGVPDSYRNLLSLQGTPSITRDRIPSRADSDTSLEALFQSVACAVEPARCEALGCTVGGIGCPSFRSDAVRMLITITDEENQCETCTSNTAGDAANALRTQGVTFAGINAGTHVPTTIDLTAIAEQSASFDSRGNPLVFSAGDAGTPAGAEALVRAVTSAVNELVRSRPLRISVDPSDEPGDAGDALQFIERLEVNVTRSGCLLVRETSDINPRDGYDDTFDAVLPGNRVCWDVVARRNSFVEPTEEPQLFRARLTVRGDGSPIDQRVVYFLVPPRIDTHGPE